MSERRNRKDGPGYFKMRSGLNELLELQRDNATQMVFLQEFNSWGHPSCFWFASLGSMIRALAAANVRSGIGPMKNLSTDADIPEEA